MKKRIVKKWKLRKEVKQFLDAAFGFIVAAAWGILLIACIRGGF